MNSFIVVSYGMVDVCIGGAADKLPRERGKLDLTQRCREAGFAGCESNNGK